MSRSVDVVLTGDGEALLAVAAEALRAGQRLLVVMRRGDARAARRLRRALRGAASAGSGRLSVMTSAEVVCADGVDQVEAVVIRSLRTGRVRAVNAIAYRSCAELPETARERP